MQSCLSETCLFLLEGCKFLQQTASDFNPEASGGAASYQKKQQFKKIMYISMTSINQCTVLTQFREINSGLDSCTTLSCNKAIITNSFCIISDKSPCSHDPFYSPWSSRGAIQGHGFSSSCSWNSESPRNCQNKPWLEVRATVLHTKHVSVSKIWPNLLLTVFTWSWPVKNLQRNTVSNTAKCNYLK